MSNELHGRGERVAVTPQGEQANPREVQNNAGGYVYQLDEFDTLLRFLILGTAGGTYYATERDHTKQALEVVRRCIAADAIRALDLAVDVSDSGRAPKNDQAIFVLAQACAADDVNVRRAAYAAIPKICRTATHLFTFISLVKEYRGWSRGLREAVGRWYNGRDIETLAYQVVKYRSRKIDGNAWTNRDVLRLAHPRQNGEDFSALYRWTCGNEVDPELLPPVVRGYLAAQAEGANIPEVIANYRLPWEALPTGIDRAGWCALLDAKALPLGALVRQLPTLTRAEVFQDRDRVREVIGLLTNEDHLHAARIHPYNVLMALKTYGAGVSVRGNNTWQPVTSIIDALHEAFYRSFANVEPMGGRTLLALDVSGSMGAHINKPESNWNAKTRRWEPQINDAGLITAREGAAAMAAVTLGTEPAGSVDTIAYTSEGSRGSVKLDHSRRTWGGSVTEMNISGRQRLDDVLKAVDALPYGGTDCALPFLWADHVSRVYDRIISYTDNESWAGNIHPDQALRDYRKKYNPDTRLVAVGMTATEYTVGDPNDAGTLNVVGFDAAAPNLISAFCRGEI